MAFEIVHNVEKGVRQLLGAPTDVADWASEVQGRPRPLFEAHPTLRDVYARFLADLPDAYEMADDWWARCVGAQLDLGLDSAAALQAAYEKRVAGPASLPLVVWFIRSSWLAADRANRALPPEDRVPPEHVLLGWLVDAGLDEYVRLLTCMPYWPIGLDADGNWC